MLLQSALPNLVTEVRETKATGKGGLMEKGVPNQKSTIGIFVIYCMC